MAAKFTLNMRVRSIIANEHAACMRQLVLTPENTVNSPGDMTFYVSKESVAGVDPGDSFDIDFVYRPKQTNQA